jgi:hypothetical protein
VRLTDIVEKGEKMNTTRESPYGTNERKMAFEERKIKISTLWTSVMFFMVFADILSFTYPSFLKDLFAGSGVGGIQITQEILLAFAILLAIPIAMIFLSRVLKYKANRWVNIISVVINIAFVIGGGSLYLHYIFFATIEIVCMLLIGWYAWKWTNPEG